MKNKYPLFLKTYKLILYLHRLVQNFNRDYKYTLGKSMLDTGWETLDNIISANSVPNNIKAPSIRNVSSSFDKLKIRIRACYDIGLISHKKFGYIIEQEIEIGKMINGWLKWAESPNTSVCAHT